MPAVSVLTHRRPVGCRVQVEVVRDAGRHQVQRRVPDRRDVELRDLVGIEPELRHLVGRVCHAVDAPLLRRLLLLHRPHAVLR